MKKLNAPLKRRRNIASKPCSKWRRRLTRSRHRDSCRAKSKRGKWTRKSSKEGFDYLLRVVHRYTLGTLSNHDGDDYDYDYDDDDYGDDYNDDDDDYNDDYGDDDNDDYNDDYGDDDNDYEEDDYDDDDYDEVHDGDGTNLYIVQ